MYNKLFTKILDSSIWLENKSTRIVWITFLACMDQDGMVALSSIGNVANRARVSEEEAENAIECLESPDDKNPDQEHEGCRIERIPGVGWFVLNSGKYREIIKAETVRAQNRARAREFRAKKTPKLKSVTVTQKRDRNANVTVHNENVTLSEAEAEAKTEAKKKSKKAKKKIKCELFEIPRADVDMELWVEFLEMRFQQKKPLTERGFTLITNNLAKLPDFAINERLAESIDRKWIGLIFKDDLEGKTNGRYQQNDKADRDRDRANTTDSLIDQLRAQGDARRDTEAQRKLLGDGNGVNH